MKILVAGDIVGSPGRKALADVVARLKDAGEVDIVVANAENAAGGKGLTPKLAQELFDAGADVLTLGDHAWDRKEIMDYVRVTPRVIRPANFAPGCPGRGLVTIDSDYGKVTVINLVGRVFMAPNECPFRTVDAILEDRDSLGKVVLVDIHAEATSEKITMGRHLEGRVTAVFGTHTHVQTSDDTILAGGTGYITDLGMTGAKDSSLGRDLESVTRMFLTGMHIPFKMARDDVKLEGILLEIDPELGITTKISRVRESVVSRS